MGREQCSSLSLSLNGRGRIPFGEINRELINRQTLSFQIVPFVVGVSKNHLIIHWLVFRSVVVWSKGALP